MKLQGIWRLGLLSSMFPLAPGVSAAEGGGTPPAKPNYVIFLVDDLGPQDTSVPFVADAEGNAVRTAFNDFYVTPNLERLAADGIRFTTAYAQTVCSPTRVGIMTGRNSARHGVTDHYSGVGKKGTPPAARKGLPTEEPALPRLLKEAGYHTIHIGKWHVSGNPPTEHGFDVSIAGSHWGQPYKGFIGTPGYGGLPGLEAYDGSEFLTKALTKEAIKTLDGAAGTGKPFFLNFCFYAVHTPLATNPDATGDYSRAINDKQRMFATMVEGMDIAIGEIRQKLVDLGVADNTLIIFLGDNGSDSPVLSANGLPARPFNDFPMRGMKGSKWEGGARVPFLVSWAKLNSANPLQQNVPIQPGRIETAMVTCWDIPLTLLDLAGVKPPAKGFGEDGMSFAPYLKGMAPSRSRHEVLVHYPHKHRSEYYTWLRKGSMKLILNLANGSCELYDLAADPVESSNLASARPELKEELEKELRNRLDTVWGPAGPLWPVP